jgi:CubicO group peptidase (beta-lactamase class C family)
MKHSFLVFILGFCFLAAGCSSPQANATPGLDIPWPTQGWQTSTPEEQGMDPGLLEDMLMAVEGQNLGLHSLLVIRHGRIVSETYYAAFTAKTHHEQYSVTKSFIGTLVGIALEQGFIKSLDTPVVDLFPGVSFANPDPRKDAMTVEDLLTMRAGLDWEEGDPAYMALSNSPDWAIFMLNLPMATEPGTSFVYCSGCSHVLSSILYWVTWQNVRKFADRNLLKPLGISDYGWETDNQGIHLGGWGMQLTPRDMAKLGYLYLHEGNWEGEQIVPKGWVEQATQSHVDFEDGNGYGYQWWIYPGFAGMAQGVYSALGRYGQTIFVVPELDLVVVTTAQVENHDPIFELIADYIIPAVQK